MSSNIQERGGQFMPEFNLILAQRLVTMPLIEGQMYRLTFRGSYIYDPYGYEDEEDWRGIDVIYMWPASGDGSHDRHHLVFVESKALTNLQYWQENSLTAEYSGILNGTGWPIEIRFDSPTGFLARNIKSGFINVTIEALADTDPILEAHKLARLETSRRAAANAAQKAKAEAEEADQRKRCEQAALLQREDEIRRGVEIHRRIARKNRNFLDPDYRDVFVRRHFKSILSELRPIWEQEYDQLFQDQELLNALKQQAQDVIEWHEARLDMILEAERLDLIPEVIQPVPSPQPTYYEELINKINAGEQVAIEPLRERVQDLFREKIILEAKRRTAVRQGRSDTVRGIDRQLTDVRRELTETRAVIEKLGPSVELKDPRERGQSLEDLFFADYETEQRIVDQLTNASDPQTAEAVKALYAERRAKLFQQDTESYT